MASSELRKRKMEEYEMQLFSFHSRAVYATLKSIVSERILSTIEKMCQTIEKTYKLNSENLTVLKTNQKNLETTYFKGAMPHLKNIENIVNKYVAVPSNVLLEEDKYQRIQYNDTEFENINQRLEDLQQRAKNATILNTVLKEELQTLDQFPISEESVNKMCNVVENLTCSDVNENIYQLLEDYKQFSTSLFDTTQITTKIKYNTVDNLKCKEFDLSTL
ncbi:protein MIS12 homolog isoform X1 [Bombus vosnesenskii]|uniref:Protein MIS12 homolog isoform X1 n=2 Tax=Pyrobombus TaxID=144703 RepID=A0A6J3KK36_9HYME|nr:protein MIS12 homolog isoform X1 [Bombus vancouverensis nearcticus]XP_033302067.1 protein MIS12 homolog isoform X1 [Bombus bifarius]XP_033352254.1 protein MIS12 homolog isoform X1 [Bombus vosnesenskii]XP_050479851.1 protein MIS12 homolog isoform X1 [Bombus huntii]